MTNMTREESKALLKWYIEQGVDETIGETAHSAFSELSAGTREASPVPAEAKLTNLTTAKPAAPLPSLQPIESIVKEAETIARSASSLADLKDAIMAFEGCSLKHTAMNTVFCDGNAEADLMLVGEAPGAEEDRQGRPFVGISGQLLDRMLATIGHDRENSYIANVLPWRPPGNRNPTPHEINICLPFIRRHIELVSPRVVLLVGGISAKALLNTSEGITRIRGNWHTLDLSGHIIDTLPTFHPAYLLRQPAAKKRAWQDLLAVQRKLEPSG